MKQSIYCPICRIKVLNYDGRSTTELSAECKKCGRIIFFNGDTGMVRTERKKLRDASGTRFW